MEKFIYSNEIAQLKFYGIVIRIDVLIVDNKPITWVVTKRTCNKRDEETWTFSDIKLAIPKFKDLINKINTSWGNELSKLLPNE